MSCLALLNGSDRVTMTSEYCGTAIPHVYFTTLQWLRAMGPSSSSAFLINQAGRATYIWYVLSFSTVLHLE